MATLHNINPKADVLRREHAFRVNAQAAKGLQDVLIGNLGPTGTLKMLVGGAGDIKITKDGNVLLKEMQIQHPTAAILARAAVAQDIVTGDGTTSSMLIIGEIMRLAENLLTEGVHPRKLSEGLEIAQQWAIEFLNKFANTKYDIIHDRELLTNIARSSLRTKLTDKLADQLADYVVDAIHCIRPREEDADDTEGKIPLDLYMVEVLPIMCGMNSDTSFIRGMVMDHGCRHPDMPAKLSNCYVLTCNVNLEYEKTEVNSSFFYNDASHRLRMAEAERRYTDNKVRQIINLKRSLCTEENGKNLVVFNQKGIDPPALEMLAREGIMALRRVKRRNMERLTLCCGGTPVNSVSDLTESDLGFARSCWEISLEDEKYTFVDGVSDPRACCILVKAPTNHELEQTKDAIRDGLRACRNAIVDKSLVPGAGAFEIACSEYLRNKASISNLGKASLGVSMFADALLVIPKILAKNSGFDQQDTLLKLLQSYRTQVKAGTTEESVEVGVDIVTGDVIASGQAGIWDNTCVKKQLITLTTTLAGQLILIDEVIKAGKNMKPQ